MWVMMPQIVVEEPLAGPGLHKIGDTESETLMTCSRRW